MSQYRNYSPSRPSDTYCMVVTLCNVVSPLQFDMQGKIVAWVHSPTQFNAYFCQGSCINPLIGSNITLHAQIQAKLHATKPSVVNNPCCVPTKLSSLDVYYYAGREKKNLTLHDMVVEECDCR
ncbi:hypothetical protein CHS0354_020733 [Potamilus streckersoni]|uniref:TGF-beta family profile domain-containing protein n=1 Tax=Potamilus streckersoni TaxID=2493646 RepID=A0AAE0SV86_9BIVA|nr:hypothetical protein CHS0354_020733 [Potamilus streckersoni]